MDLEWQAESFIVVGDEHVRASIPYGVAFLSWQSSGSEHDIQNGDPDGLILKRGNEILDSVSYGGTIELVTEGSGGAPDDPDGALQTISRCPTSTDANENSRDFLLGSPTPGQHNSCGSD